MANVPNGGKKSDYAERLKRQRTTSAVKFYLIAIILGGLLGLAWIKRAEIQSVYNNLVNNTPPAPAPEPSKAPAEPKVAVAPPVPEPKKATEPAVSIPPKPPAVIQQPAVSAKDEAAAHKLLADGKALLEKFDFSGASKNFDDAAKLKIGAPLKAEAMTWIAKANAFQSATKHIAIADYAQSENAVIVEHNDGTEWRGVKVKEDDNVIGINVLVDEARPAAEGRQRLDIPKAEIKRVVPLPLSKRRTDFADLVLATESNTTISHSTDYYDMVYLSKRLGLGVECIKYLNRAFDGGPGHAPDPNLGDSYRHVVISRALRRATLLMAGNRRQQTELELKKLRETLPGFGPVEEEIAAFQVQVMNKVSKDFVPSFAVKDNRNDFQKRAERKEEFDKSEKAKPPAPEPGIEIGSANSLTSAGPAAKILERANTKFELGVNKFRQYVPGVGGNKVRNNQILIEARTLLQEAIEIYEEALKLEPQNNAIRDRQQTANMMVYSCNKNMILG